MTGIFKNLKFPDTLEYRSDNEHIPIEFYSIAFPLSKRIDMHLGFFSSNAIKVLNAVFARFIYNDGSLRLIINNILSHQDKSNLLEDSTIDDENYVKNIFENLTKLKNEFSGGPHFFDCLKYLIKKKRLEILPVSTIHKSLSHYKNLLFYDDCNNILFTEGSANFTAAGILSNGESFNVSRSWGTSPELKRIEKAKKRFNNILSKNHPDYKYLEAKDVITAINKIGDEKDINDLVLSGNNLFRKIKSNKISKALQEAELEFKAITDKVINTLRFPYPEPRKYQTDAYISWKKNNYKGIFAMATGTGKTLTAINCLINEYKKTEIQKNIFVVPGEELVRQWGEELLECNFRNLFLWYSKNKKLKRDIENIKILKKSNSLNVIVTYDSFKLPRFQSIFQDSLKDFTFIFDEVHNMGAAGIRQILKDKIFNKLIGLSATPLRLWDDEGENEFITTLFNSYHPKYTFLFSMEDAIGKFLVPYRYEPYFTSLTDEEWEQYLEYTAQIPKSSEKGKINTTAALKRQLLLDQAENKAPILINILHTLVKNNNYKWTLVYCPKGRDDEERIIHKLGRIAANTFPKLNIQFFVGETKDRELLLKDFEEKQVDMLFAIKVLDEGVNVPMAKNAIFLASGKNYREFVQRRGRILRKYKTLNYEKTTANIFDIVVLPTIEQYKNNVVTAKKLIISEFRRLLEFYNMSMKEINVFWKIENEIEKFGLTQYYIENYIDNE